MIFHENHLPADDSHEISCLICYFLEGVKILNCRLLQIIGGALRVFFFFASDGMRAFLTVKECGYLRVSEHLSGTVRKVFLAAETEVWDYASSGLNLYDGGSLIEAGKYVT